AELLAKADIAIGAGGSITWERMFLGLPAIVFTVADNQVDVANHLNSLGFIFYLGDIKTLENKNTVKDLMNYVSSAESIQIQSEKLLAIKYASSNKVVSQLVN
ncbi:MAG: hypothetical protein HKP09_07285, partial [Enterobacterales bacterium]|nr:hypothetical protein [Enterobacterales bacterium]